MHEHAVAKSEDASVPVPVGPAGHLDLRVASMLLGEEQIGSTVAKGVNSGVSKREEHRLRCYLVLHDSVAISIAGEPFGAYGSSIRASSARNWP
jgi:hypothetical protein